MKKILSSWNQRATPSSLRLMMALMLVLGPSAYADEGPQESLAMHGTPKYGHDFEYFEYVNPDAPKGGTFHLAATGSFDSLNPFLVRGTPPLGLGTGYFSLVYESLMYRSWDEPFSLYGLLAASVVVPSDRSSITFNLNPNAHWSDGKPITSDDVLFSFTTLRDKGRPNHRSYYKKVSNVEVLSELSIRFSLAKNADGSVDREMPLILGLMPILPHHDWLDRDFNQTTWRIPVGSGAYTISKVDEGRSITYKRDPNYWGRNVPSQRGINNFDTIQIDYYRDDTIALEAFKAGQFDLRREMDPNRWVTAYDFPAAHDGRVMLDHVVHQSNNYGFILEPASGFVLNTRRPLFKDPALRRALAYTFDSGWIDHNLFHDQYHRTESFFPNSELAAPPLPDAQEKAVLAPYQDRLDDTLFTVPVTPPSTDGSPQSQRDHLLKATAILHQAGYTLTDDQLYTPAKNPVAFDILLLRGTNEEKIALEWSRSLKRLGIHVQIKPVDSAQYQARLSQFDYDVTTSKWSNSLSPGNEQIGTYWGSKAVDQMGSRNYAGVNDPVVDALAQSIVTATSRQDLVIATHALDRVLMGGHYVIPFYYLGADNIAYWTAHLKHPARSAIYGSVFETWWYQ